MTGLKLVQNKVTIHDDLPIPKAQEGEALIRVLLAGICATDLELVKGYAGGFNGILGHEFVGVVEACENKSWIGRRVVANINIGCRECDICRHDGPEHCPNRSVLGIFNRDGIFAQYVALPLANLLAVPRHVANELAVFTEPLAAALRIAEQVVFKKGSRIAVVGPGRLGMLIGKVLALHGGEVTMYGRTRSSMKLPQAWGLGSELIDNAPENSYDIVVEATGNPDGLTASLKMVRPRGTLVLKSTFAQQTTVDLTKVVVDEITVVGSRCGPLDKALHLLQKKLVPVTDLIDGRYALADGLEAIDHAGQSGVRKILLTIDSLNR